MHERNPSLLTYKYELVVDGKVVYHGMSTDLERAQKFHLRRRPTSKVVQIGEPTTHQDAWD